MEARARWKYVWPALVWLAVARPAKAAERAPVAIGEIGTRVTRGRIDLRKALRSALERELGALEMSSSKRYVLSASLVKLEPKGAGVACTVSTVLREERSGAIRAVLVGRAQASFEGEEAELGALDAAVRGAVASIPAATR
jgi:hypothetical protein